MLWNGKSSEKRLRRAQEDYPCEQSFVEFQTAVAHADHDVSPSATFQATCEIPPPTLQCEERPRSQCTETKDQESPHC